MLGDGTVASDGPLWSPDGRTLWISQSSDIVRLQVGADGSLSGPVVIPLTTTITGLNGRQRVTDDLPSGMALSADGSALYVALNGVNELGVVDTGTSTLGQVIAVGNAPRQVVLVGRDAFVSNQGGRTARLGDVTNQSDGTPIVSDPVTGAATTGTVSEVDLSTGRKIADIPVGLQPTAEYLSADGTLMVANSNGDSVSMIDPATARVWQTVNVNPVPGATVGSYPNAITMPDAGHILVSLGRDNALAVYGYAGPTKPVTYQGLLATDWYPVQVQYDQAIGQVVITNDKGIGARGPLSTIHKGPGTTAATGHKTSDDTGSVTRFAMPTTAALGDYTHQVFLNNNWEHLLATAARRAPSATAAPVAVPVRLGDPSAIKHVFVIIRENRTYDQVLGDIGKGNSDPSLAQFGATVTPNAHSLANIFGLFDNFYDEGTLSGDGHSWIVQADANDYIEKEFGEFYRSYPAHGGDALAYQRTGFIWNAVQAAGKSVKNFGEFNNALNLPDPTPTWAQWYQDSQILEGKAQGTLPVPVSRAYTHSDIPSLNAIDDHDFPKFDLDIPDQYRADIWLRSFQRSEQSMAVMRRGHSTHKYWVPDGLAALNLVWMPDDHTSAPGSGQPDPVAQVADNDLAVGRMIDAISHSRFWKSSAVFVLEDDTQNGVDHVDGHRGPLLIASPYATRGVIDDTYYSQINMVKTVEQILGITPMNQEDRAAEPMFDAFTNTPDTTPYTLKPNQIPLTQGLTTASAARSGAQSGPASTAPAASDLGRPADQAGVPAAARAVYAQWASWSRGQHFGGAHPIMDWASPQQLNRVTWYSAHGWKTPYPGDTAILTPNQVPGRDLPPVPPRLTPARTGGSR